MGRSCFCFQNIKLLSNLTKKKTIISKNPTFFFKTFILMVKYKLTNLKFKTTILIRIQRPSGGKLSKKMMSFSLILIPNTSTDTYKPHCILRDYRI